MKERMTAAEFKAMTANKPATSAAKRSKQNKRGNTRGGRFEGRSGEVSQSTVRTVQPYTLAVAVVQVGKCRWYRELNGEKDDPGSGEGKEAWKAWCTNISEKS